MKISVLASGSKGNCTFIEENNTRILVDLGMPCPYIEAQLSELEIDPASIKAVLITHTHSDHIVGLNSFYRKYKPTIYITRKMLPWLRLSLKEEDYHFYEEEATIIDDVLLNIIKTSHDVDDSVGFLINDRLVYITDTGYLNKKYFPLLSNKEIYILESNHDLEMLVDGQYPYHLKQRILSDKGHLSNKDASLYLSQLIGNRTKKIILAHLSEENNTKEKALETLLARINQNDVEQIVIATQNERTELILI